MIWFALAFALLLIISIKFVIKESHDRFGDAKFTAFGFATLGVVVAVLAGVAFNGIAMLTIAPQNIKVDDAIYIQEITLGNNDFYVGKTTSYNTQGDTNNSYYWVEDGRVVVVPAGDLDMHETNGKPRVVYTHYTTKWQWLTIFDGGTTIDVYR